MCGINYIWIDAINSTASHVVPEAQSLGPSPIQAPILAERLRAEGRLCAPEVATDHV